MLYRWQKTLLLKFLFIFVIVSIISFLYPFFKFFIHDVLVPVFRQNLSPDDPSYTAYRNALRMNPRFMDENRIAFDEYAKKRPSKFTKKTLDDTFLQFYKSPISDESVANEDISTAVHEPLSLEVKFKDNPYIKNFSYISWHLFPSQFNPDL
jgi:hypothetical protein